VLLEEIPLDQLLSEPAVAPGGPNGRLVAIFEVAHDLAHRSVLRQSEVRPYGEAETPDRGPLGAIPVLVLHDAPRERHASDHMNGRAPEAPVLRRWPSSHGMDPYVIRIVAARQRVGAENGSVPRPAGGDGGGQASIREDMATGT